MPDPKAKEDDAIGYIIESLISVLLKLDDS